MKHAMNMVAEFHAKHGAPELDHVATPEEIEARRVLRMDLITEECMELIDALGLHTGDGVISVGPPDVVKVADALADLLYVTVGAALEWGIPLDRVFAEVHRSNMTKTPGTKRGDGKILKGAGYEPPRIAEVLSDSPVAPEPSAADVERVAVALYLAWHAKWSGQDNVTSADIDEHGTWFDMSDDEKDDYRAEAREAIRLGADAERCGK